jgi:succinate dehydrogenase / fumarate reductase cytochrome b subunit
MSAATPLKEKTFSGDTERKLPKSFIMRRIHSMFGLWLAIYLFEHLLVNSQAAFYFQDDGASFIRMVNKLEDLPYLPVIEIVFLGLPFFIHMVWGVLYLRSAKYNAHKTDGEKPALPQYKRNRAYSWERITAWILLPLIILHVLHMRLWNGHLVTYHGGQSHYMTRLMEEKGLYGVSERLGAKIYRQDDLDSLEKSLSQDKSSLEKLEPTSEEYYRFQDKIGEDEKWIETAKKKPLKKGQVLAITSTPGAAFFLMARETFKSPVMVLLYSLFVIAACYHAFNGFWTFMITWGVTLTRRSQKWMRRCTNVLMLVTTLMGLIAVWGVYWTVQFQS